MYKIFTTLQVESKGNYVQQFQGFYVISIEVFHEKQRLLLKNLTGNPYENCRDFCVLFIIEGLEKYWFLTQIRKGKSYKKCKDSCISPTGFL